MIAPFPFVISRVKEKWLLIDGDIGIPRVMVLYIRSKFGRLELGTVVGVGAALVGRTLYAISYILR